MNQAPQVPSGYGSVPLSKLFAVLETGPSGLDQAQAERRLEVFGPNTATTAARPRRSAAALFVAQFKEPLVAILIFAAIVSMFAGQLVEATLVVGIILASATLTFFQEQRASRAVEALMTRVSLRSEVIRSGKLLSIPSSQVVPGDLILLSAGTLIPADGVLMDAKDLYVHQGALTGESFPAEKEPGISPADAPLSHQRNCVFASTSVRSGTGKMIAVRCGRSTHFGKISDRLRLRPPESDFERGLRHFGYLLARAMTVFVVVVLCANLLLDKPFIESLMFSLAIAVGISPELLPAILGQTLSQGARRLAHGGVIVRKLNSIESLGNLSVLCSDKTGTLTTGEVRLVLTSNPNGEAEPSTGRLAFLNSSFESGIANQLDRAIRQQLSDQSALLGIYEKLDEIPYDFQRRRLTVVVRERAKPDAPALLIMKGAVPNVLEVCEPLSQDRRASVDDITRVWAEQGLRVLAVATREVKGQRLFTKDDEYGFHLQGFMTFEDPPHPDAPAAIEELKSLGVGMKIVTGDQAPVARHIAQKVGLPNLAVLTSRDLDALTDDELGWAAEQTGIFAEVDPQQKERIVIALKKRGHSVGYLGDGINDAPALRSADVGISVEGAVDVAKETADLVLVSAHLGILSRGIRIGRITFANTLKYLHTTSSANFGNMITMALASLFLPFLPLMASQVLLNNFLADVPAFALSGDRVDDSRLRAPVRWDLREVRAFMLRFGAVSSCFDGLTFVVLLFAFNTGTEAFRTGWFIESLLTQIAILFIVRTRGPFLASRPSRTLVVAAGSAAMTALLLPITPLGRWFGFLPPQPLVLTAMIAITVAYAYASERLKRSLWPSPTG